MANSEQDYGQSLSSSDIEYAVAFNKLPSLSHMI